MTPGIPVVVEKDTLFYLYAKRGGHTPQQRAKDEMCIRDRCEGTLDVLSFQVDDVVKAFAGHVVFQQVLPPVAGNDALAVVHEGEARIQVGVVAQQGFYELVLEGIVQEECGVRFEDCLLYTSRCV